MKPTDLRGILQYIPRFREKTFILSVDGAIVTEENFANILLDVAVLRSLSIRVVLVHGAFADGSGWRGVYDKLTARGYRVTIVQNPLTSLEDDVAATTRALDLQDGPLMRAALFGLGPAGARLLLVLHHLVVDGVSWRVLLEDLAAISDATQLADRVIGVLERPFSVAALPSTYTPRSPAVSTATSRRML